jgi:hypothetical protein
VRFPNAARLDLCHRIRLKLGVASALMIASLFTRRSPSLPFTSLSLSPTHPGFSSLTNLAASYFQVLPISHVFNSLSLNSSQTISAFLNLPLFPLCPQPRTPCCLFVSRRPMPTIRRPVSETLAFRNVRNIASPHPTPRSSHRLSIRTNIGTHSDQWIHNHGYTQEGGTTHHRAQDTFQFILSLILLTPCSWLPRDIFASHVPTVFFCLLQGGFTKHI